MSWLEFLRQFRVGEYAIFDFVVVFMVIVTLSRVLPKIFLKTRVYIPTRSWLLLALPVGILVHLIFGIITPLTRDFININDHYILKIVIITLFILGIKGIKIVNPAQGGPEQARKDSAKKDG